MTLTKTLTAYQRLVDWLIEYIRQNPTQELNYKYIMRVLSSQKEFFIRCYLIDNKYMYGSILKEAQSKVGQ